MGCRLSLFLLICLILVSLVNSLDPGVRYEDDAVIIEAADLNDEVPQEKSDRTKRNIIFTDTFPTPIRHIGGVSTRLHTIGPCFTSKGTLGKCTSFRQCYPYFKLPELGNWETWILGMYDTCSYFTEQGRQMFGVCCTNPVTQSTEKPTTKKPKPTTTTEAPIIEEPDEKPDSENENKFIPPALSISNWPPPIPTHPPDHTIPPLPTHPPSLQYPTHPPSPGYPTPPTHPTRPTPPTPGYPTHPPIPGYPTHPSIPTHPTRPTVGYPTHPTRPSTTTTKKPSYPSDTGNNHQQCGLKLGYSDQERIVGGSNADLGEWDWIAALFNGGRQFCGGSLIDNMHILTAAHCVAHMSSWDVARLTVRLGDYNIKTNSEAQHVEKKVKRVVRHRGFDSRTLYNDVAILTMDSPVQFSNKIRPICLPSGSDSYAGQTGTVIGWGSLREMGPQPAVLQEVELRIWTNSECRAKYGPAAPGGIVEHMLCAGHAGKDSCSGDSGGPLMVQSGSSWTQVGIVSWGIGCGKGQYPGVYTRVTHFLPWISKNSKS